jgi:hypothetical protein
MSATTSPGVLSQTDVIFRFDGSRDWRWGSSWSGSLNSAGFTMSLPVVSAADAWRRWRLLPGSLLR